MLIRDRNDEILQLFDSRIRSRLKQHISEDVIDEFHCSPQGPHSESLAALLRYFRGESIRGKLAIVCRAAGQYQLCRATGIRGVPPVLDADVFSSPEEAANAVFARRVEELRKA